MTDAKNSTPPESGKRRKRYLLVAGGALVLVVLATGWIGYAAWRKHVADVGAMLDMTPLAQGLGKGFEALGKGLENLGTELSAAGEFSQQFVADLSQDRLSSAYQATSKAFKQRMNENRFSRFVEGHPDLKDATARIDFTLNKKSENGTVSLTGNVMRITTQRQTNVKLVIVNEDGGLKVDQLVLSDDKAP